MNVWWILLGLASVGFALSVYFTAAYFGSAATVLPGVPGALCREEEGSCLTVLQTPYARLLGVPNAVVGLLFYLLVGVMAALALAGQPQEWLWRIAFLGAAGSVLVAPYLIWALVARLKTWCPL